MRTYAADVTDILGWRGGIPKSGRTPDIIAYRFSIIYSTQPTTLAKMKNRTELFVNDK